MLGLLVSCPSVAGALLQTLRWEGGLRVYRAVFQWPREK